MSTTIPPALAIPQAQGQCKRAKAITSEEKNGWNDTLKPSNFQM